MDVIKKEDPRHAAAQKVIDAMEEFFCLQPTAGAVQWIEDSLGRVIVFTRGEYRDKIRDLLNEESFVSPEKGFEASCLDENEVDTVLMQAAEMMYGDDE